MHIPLTLAELRQARAGLAGSLGLVPTRGALHRGHLSLVQQARAENDHVAVSLIAAPSVPGPLEDVSRHPQDLEPDLDLLRPLGVDLVWAPPPEEVFPPGFQTWVTVEAVGAPLEGKHRPGHFRGVATRAARLFNAFTPDRAYFGQKDAQQVAVIHQMVRDLSFPLELRVCPTVREPDGLAVSRRNANLSADERRAAVVVYQALVAAREAFRTGTREADMLRALMSSTLAAEPLAREEYVSVADPVSLAELAQVDEARGALLSLAVRVGKTRLTDNQLLP
jgi:pantoate--beta-alanine ligase